MLNKILSSEFCVLICVYYSNCIAIMSNICDRTDTCSCTCNYYFMVKYMRLCIDYI